MRVLELFTLRRVWISPNVVVMLELTLEFITFTSGSFPLIGSWLYLAGLIIGYLSVCFEKAPRNVVLKIKLFLVAMES